MDNRTLFNIFKVTINSEHDSYEFYRGAAEGTSEIEAKWLFEELAEIELIYRNKLQGLYSKLRKSNERPEQFRSHPIEKKIILDFEDMTRASGKTA